jgi:hypothetical protein
MRNALAKFQRFMASADLSGDRSKKIMNVTANLVMPANAGIQDRRRRATSRHLSRRELWIPAYAGMTDCRMALGWIDRDETLLGGYS